MNFSGKTSQPKRHDKLAMELIAHGNEHLDMAFDPTTGAVTRFLVRASGWNVVNNPVLQTGLRLLVRMPEHGSNRAFTSDQKLPSAEFEEPGRLVLRYETIHTPKGGELPISASVKIALTDDGQRLSSFLQSVGVCF